LVDLLTKQKKDGGEEKTLEVFLLNIFRFVKRKKKGDKGQSLGWLYAQYNRDEKPKISGRDALLKHEGIHPKIIIGHIMA